MAGCLRSLSWPGPRIVTNGMTWMPLNRTGSSASNWRGRW